MSLALHSDGCIVGGKTYLYRVTFAPKCPHTVMKTAVIEMRAMSDELAQEYAGSFIRLAQMRVIEVIRIGE